MQIQGTSKLLSYEIEKKKQMVGKSRVTINEVKSKTLYYEQH